MTLTFADLAQVNRQRCEAPNGFNHPLDTWSLSDWFLAAFGELGEAANVAKKLNRVRDGIKGNRETEAELRAKLIHETGDALVYLDLMAQSAGFTLAEAVTEAFNGKSDELGMPYRLGDGGAGLNTDCPTCDGQGWVIEIGTEWVCCGDFLSTGECCAAIYGTDRLVPAPVEQQVTCPECHGTRGAE